MTTKIQGKRIEIVEDYLDLKKGSVYTINAKHANGLIDKGVAIELDGEETKKPKAKKKEVKADKEPTLKELRAQYPDIKATSVKSFKEKLAALEHDCKDCDSDKPCKGCQESAQTTNVPNRD